MEATTVLHKHKVIAPKLRFKGFNDIWKSCMLNDVTQYTKGFAFKSDDYKDEGTRIIRVSDLGADRIKTDNEKIFIETANINLYEKYKLISGNIIITTVGSKPELLESAVGRGIFVKKDDEGLLNQNLLKFDNIKGVDNGFIMGLINSKKYQLHIKGIARGNANQANITVVDLLQYKLAIPTLPEQQKIASFLSAVDEKIQQLTRKKELLEQYKKGVMQQLFSGKLRFKDENGKAFPKWQEKLLGDLIEIGSSKRVLQEDWKEEGVPFLRTREIINLSNGVEFRTPIFISENLFAELKSKYGVPQNGDILATGVGTIGEMYIVQKSDRFYFKDGNVIWFKMNDNLDSNYISQLFKTRYIKKQLLDNASITTVATFTIDGARKTKIIFPFIQEQKKIANYLSNIDNKIEIVNKQITQTQTFKKGLLQQMFV